MDSLKEKVIRGSFAKLIAQAGSVVLRIVALVVLARMLAPEDFGLVGMAAAVIGVLNLFRDFGLSTATIRHADISGAQLSTLFWVNVGVGATLTTALCLAAPAIAAFYHEPRLANVARGLSLCFVINALGIQHAALIQRQMRFSLLAIIEGVSLMTSLLVAFSMAVAGLGYWALVGMSLVTPTIYSVIVWRYSGWIPALPRWHTGAASIVRVGGVITLNSVIMYVAYNLDKVLLGRIWGTEALGLYGRSYQLVNIPTETMNAAVGAVSLSALSRMTHEPDRLRAYFLKGYTLLVSVTLPITVACGLLAPELVTVLLGPKWVEAAPIFRLLAPSILVFGMINPFWPLLVALGLMARSLKMALVLAPLVIAGYLIGLPYGPRGVACGFSATMVLWLVPHIAWTIHGTGIHLKVVLSAISRPMLSAGASCVTAGAFMLLLPESLPHPLRLLLGCGVIAATYLWFLFYAMGQRAFYVDIFKTFLARPKAM